jgi:phosphomannomutase
LRTGYEPYAQSGEINFEVIDKEAAMEAVSAAFSEAEQDQLDGLTVDFGPSWLNLRPSNTEPVLRLNVEAPDSTGVDALVASVAEIIKEDS